MCEGCPEVAAVLFYGEESQSPLWNFPDALQWSRADKICLLPLKSIILMS